LSDGNVLSVLIKDPLTYLPKVPLSKSSAKPKIVPFVPKKLAFAVDEPAL